MSKKTFSDIEIKKLSKNKYVKSVSECGITYTDDFKVHFISENKLGKSPSKIFSEAGFDIDIIGKSRIYNACRRWRKAFKDNGALGLRDTRKFNSGRSLSRELTLEEIIAKQKAEIEYWKTEANILKKLELSERQVRKNKLQPALIFELIRSTVDTLKANKMVSHLCEIANVSTSGYYNYLNSIDTRLSKEEHDLKLKEVIVKAIKYKNKPKGSRQVKMILESVFGIIINRKCIQRIMRKYELKCKVRKANPYRRMMKATKEHTVVPNKLNREFKQEVAGKVLLTDITYLPYGNGSIAYLSTIKDSCSNEILAHKLSNSLKLDIALDTINILMKNNKKILHKDAFIHSDQGVHYTNPKFQELLKKNKLDQSMSRRGNCWDNAPQESFFGHLKDEIDYKSCECFEELEFMIDEYIYYYNNERGQWNLKKQTPVKYRNLLLVS